MRSYHRDYDTFTLECWGNGFAYALTHKATDMQVYLQGDDAAIFEQELAAFENAYPNEASDKIMARLWDMYEIAAVYKG